MQTNFKTGLDRDRRGSTLVVVLALLALLSILGLSFVLYSGSEKTSAENFSGAAVAKANDQPRPSTEILTRFAGRRLLTGSLDSERNSALYGGRHTLLANLVGRDIHPHSGRGVNVIEMPAGGTRTGLPVVDQNYDRQPDSIEDTNGNGTLDPNEDLNNNGILDPDLRLLELNDSPSANYGSVPLEDVNNNGILDNGEDLNNNGRLDSRPASDADYTAPDINSVFLAFNGMALDPYDRPVHVVIPSFARPQYHRQIFTGGKASPLLSWETSGSALHPFHPQMGAGLDTARRVLRPHPLHRDYAPNGVHRGPRYVLTKAEANLLGLSGPFPFGHSEDKDFDRQLDPGEDLNDNGILDTEAHHGVWTLGRWQPKTYYRAGQWVLDSPDSNATGNPTLVRKYFRVEQAGMSGNSMPNFAAVPVGNATNSGGTTPVFRRFARFQPRYEFDADPDGDGIKEAVWLDLDFPVQSLGNGKRAIPMFAFTIYDADGLINLNTAGNTSGLTNNLNVINGNSQFISRSNLGLSPAEINPLWALDARPNEDFPLSGRTKRDVFADHIQQFGIPSNQAGPNTWIENANMEWWFLQKGRAVTQPVTGSVLSWVSGRHGELNRLQTTFNGNRNNPQLYPQPGFYGIDDNNNRDEGEQSPFFSSYFLARERPFVHPLDFRGSGSSFTKAGSTWLPLRLQSNLPHGFLMYQNYQAQPFQMGMGGQVSIKWGQALQGALMQGSQTIPLIDEQTESVVDERNRQPDDRLFTAGENFFLQASHGDIETTDIDSRLANLMSYNLKINRRADTIRRRFTTNSWDSRDFGRPFHGFVQPPQNGPSSDRRRAWEFWPFSEDVDNDGQLDSGEDFNNNGQLDPYARNRFGNPLYAFPPRFVPAPETSVFCPVSNFTDPFRPSLRRRLQVIANHAPLQRTDSTLVQRKLSLNHLITLLDSNQNSLTDVNEVFNRPLTVHPLNPGTTVVPLTWNVQSRPPYPPSNPTQQEWWARFDRQQMARDIYVLLYTLCGGDDSVDYTTTNDHANTMTPGSNLDQLYSTAQLREMAQFAVNVVDALDRDNVMTRFEYDKNLGPTIDSMSMMTIRRGWNLDDNAWTNTEPNNGMNTLVESRLTSGPAYNPDYPEDTLERGIVYGVEAQQLTLSEFLAVHSNAVFSPGLDGILGTPNDATGTAIDDIPEDHFATKHNDAVDQVFAYIELTNVSPIDVPLAENLWRIVIQPNVPDPDPNMVRQLTLRTNTLVEVGTRYTIGSTNETASMLLDSLFKVKQNFNAGDAAPTTYPRIAPFFTNGNPDPDFLDLISSVAGNTNPQAFPFRISSGDYYDAQGDLVSGDDKTDVPGSLLLESGSLNPFSGGRFQGGDKFVVKPLDVLIRLQRRVHPSRTTRDPIVDGQTMAGLYDRDNPWVDVDRMVYTRTQAQWEFSIRKEDNDPNGTDPTRIQDELKRLKSRERPEPFDRDAEAYRSSDAGAFQYNSLGDKNSNSPTNFVRWQPHFDRDFASLIDLFSVPIYGPHEVTNKLDPADPNFRSAGQAKFLNPDFPDNVDPSVRRDNRWARLLNFLEIPDRTDRLLPDKRKYRVSGKINLNTVRQPEVLASLLDQRDAFSTLLNDPNRHLVDVNGETSRDWWTQFIRSRDRYDPVSEFYLPGTGHGRPFRSLGLSRFGKQGIEHTLLRSMPMDTNTTAGYIKRRLFELGTQGQHNNRSIDHHTRHRLLARIAGNTTARSNVFFVFMQVDWFEAHHDRGTGHVRVGARLEAAAPQRSFFVIDRTRALEILQPGHIPRNRTYNIGRVSEDINGNGQLDAGEDINNNGFLDPTTVNSIDPETLILYQRTIE